MVKSFRYELLDLSPSKIIESLWGCSCYLYFIRRSSVNLHEANDKFLTLPSTIWEKNL